MVALMAEMKVGWMVCLRVVEMALKMVVRKVEMMVWMMAEKTVVEMV